MNILLVPVYFTGANNYLLSKDKVDVKLTSHYNLIYCENNLPKNEILLTIGIGEVKRIDSLYGLNFSIKYDNKKIIFESKVVLNTLAEFSTDNDVTFNLEPGKILGYFISNQPVFGKRELIGFYGKYIGQMCDSALVEIEYVEFTDDFKKEVNKLDTIWIKPIKYDYKDTKINVNISNLDTIEYNPNMINKIEGSLNLNNSVYLDYLIYKINLNDEYSITNFNINDNYFELISKDYLSESSTILFTVKNKLNKISNNLKLFELNYNKKDLNKSDTSLIQIIPLQLNNCICTDFNSLSTTEKYIKYFKEDTTSSVVDDINKNIIFYDAQNKILHFENLEFYANSTIQLFNYNGTKIYENELKNENYINLNLNNGLYFVIISNSNDLIRKKIFVYN